MLTMGSAIMLNGVLKLTVCALQTVDQKRGL